MMQQRWIAPAVATLIALVGSAVGQTTGPTTTTAPATTAPSGESMAVVVADVRGLVRVRESSDKPWQKATVGMKLGEGAEFQTGPKSACVCTIAPDQTIVLDRLGVISVAEAVKRGGTTRTDLLMKYGRTEYEIEAVGAKHDATIRSPSSTLAVRGTRVNLYDQPPFTPSAESYTGRAIYQYAKRQTALGGPGRGAIVRANRGSAAETALGETVVDPAIGQARTRSDAKLIETETSRGGVLSFDETTGINVIKGGAGPPGDEELAKFLPDRFNVIARWTGNQDLNLVLDPDFFPANQILANVGFFADNGTDEILFPGFGQNITASGGHIDFDHRGGANGGYEVASYNNPKSGIYGVIVIPGGRGGRDPAAVKIQAFLDGKSIDLVFPQLDEQGNLVFNEDGFVAIEISKIIERVVTTNETDVAGFTFVPSLEDLRGGEPQPEADNAAPPSKASDRAARKAALRAANDAKAAEKKQLVAQRAGERLAERERTRAARDIAKAREVDRKAGLSGLEGQMGPHLVPKK